MGDRPLRRGDVAPRVDERQQAVDPILGPLDFLFGQQRQRRASRQPVLPEQVVVQRQVVEVVAPSSSARRSMARAGRSTSRARGAAFEGRHDLVHGSRPSRPAPLPGRPRSSGSGSARALPGMCRRTDVFLGFGGSARARRRPARRSRRAPSRAALEPPVAEQRNQRRHEDEIIRAGSLDAVHRLVGDLRRRVVEQRISSSRRKRGSDVWPIAAATSRRAAARFGRVGDQADERGLGKVQIVRPRARGQRRRRRRTVRGSSSVSIGLRGLRRPRC